MKQNIEKALLSRPRAAYPPKIAEIWDNLAAEHPEQAEDTMLFYGYNSQDILAVRVLDAQDDWAWLELRTVGSPRQCFYHHVDGVWTHESGDSEPEMSAILFSKWENAGDETIARAIETEFTQFIKA